MKEIEDTRPYYKGNRVSRLTEEDNIRYYRIGNNIWLYGNVAKFAKDGKDPADCVAFWIIDEDSEWYYSPFDEHGSYIAYQISKKLVDEREDHE